MSKIVALSDIHGFYEEMMTTLELVDLTDRENKLLFLGDYVDRGEKSCQVLYKVMELAIAYPDQIIVLVGNHDQMFLDWLENPWSSLDYMERKIKTIRSFFSDTNFDQILTELETNPIEISCFFSETIQQKHQELIWWFKKIAQQRPLYYETATQIFVHAGIFEDETMWATATSDHEFLWKYPAETGRFHKDIISGHISAAEVANDIDFLGKVYWDGENHYFIDGTVEKSGRIPLLVYDTQTHRYSGFDRHNMDYFVSKSQVR